MTLAALVVALGAVVWLGRRAPLTGWRKRAVIACRLAAVAALYAALVGPGRSRAVETPRHLVYLLDQSASMDARQREWMTRRVASLEALRPARVRRAVMAFGGTTQLLVPFGQERLADPSTLTATLSGASVGADRTNLETALLSVPGILPSGQRGSVVLLSDGRETAGSVVGALGAARRLGLEVFPAPPPVFGEAKTVWEDVAVPPVVQRGASVPIQLILANGGTRAQPASVAVALQGVTVKRQRITLRPGWQVVTLQVPALGRGTMALEVELRVPGEQLTERRLAYTEVEGPPQLLFVTEKTAVLPALAAALKRRQMEVAVMRPGDLPGQDGAGRLMDYDAIVLFNVPKSSLSAEQAAALDAYVRQLGGGLVMVGLGGDLAKEIQTPSPLDALLPLQFEPKGLKESKRRICMIMLIDRSASMLGPRIAATKRAAVHLVKQLQPEDLVGVLAFDTEPRVVVEVQQAGQVGPAMVEKLVKLRSSGGTDVYPALAAATNRLELTGATLKHIILLSDGLTPFHKDAYDALVAEFRRNGTTVSTIGIGAAFINTDYLQWLSGSTGGTFYMLRSLEELPQLIARDTHEQLGRLPFTEGHFTPAKTPQTDWFAETEAWPVLRGYVTATAKPESRVDLTIDGGDGPEPLLARWGLGRGRVVSFASDADARWSPEWIRWPSFDAAWAQVVRWAMRPRMTEELFVWVDEGRDIPQLVMEGVLHDPRGELIAGEGGAVLPLSLVQTGAWRWQAGLEQIPSGWYQLSVESRPAVEAGADGAEPRASVFAKRWVHLGPAASSSEITGQPPHELLLRQMSRTTGGVYDAPDAALLPPTTVSTVTEPLLSWWLPLVIVLLLVDVWLRGSTML